MQMVLHDLPCREPISSSSGYTSGDPWNPHGGCGRSASSWTWNVTLEGGFGPPIMQFHPRSLHADRCVDGGDTSDLHRLEILVR
ncbi:MAG: hypothetical protein ACQEXJ_21500 [Myxococcota bacterium]